MTNLELVREHNGETVELQRGDTLVIRLPDNPTTGFRWAVDSLDSDVMTQVEGDYSSASSAIGSGGVRCFAFQAKGVGTSVITLKLWRSWEGDRSARSRFRVTVNVN